MRTRSTSKLINVTNEDSDQNSEHKTEIGSVSEKDINPINSIHWKAPSKLYYERPTTPNLLLQERGENNFKSFSANNIYEWNIDAQEMGFQTLPYSNIPNITNIYIFNFFFLQVLRKEPQSFKNLWI